ncbi:MAG: hypothetical protein H6Q68_3862 [Firmicutes bacterium]|nr:hypothetical protein [Bacillota bacterium]
MKFITEMDLRDLYKIEPFTNYVVELDTKITPGARQFLVDRGVTLAQPPCSDDPKTNTSQLGETEARGNWYALRLRRKMECIESLFLLIGAEFSTSGDGLLSEEIMALGKCFRDVQHAEREQITPGNIQFWGWPEEKIRNCSNNLGKHFDISELHVGLENGKVIAILNYLRASLREVEPAILEAYWNEEKQACSQQELIKNVNLIINILCIMMWKRLGGQKCKP